MLWRRCPGLMPRGLRGWIAKRFATRLFVTMQRDWRGFTTVQSYSPRRLTADEEAALAAVIIAGPEPERDGVCAWKGRSVPLAGGALRQDLPPLEHDPGSTADGIFPPEGAPEPPAKGRRSAGALQKRGLRDILKATAAAHPDKRLQLWFQDEARVGNKGRGCHRWWRRGERAPGTRQIGYQWAYIFSAVRPDTGETSGDAERQRQGHGPVSRTLRRYPGPGCARRHDVRRRRLARRARPHRPRQRHLGLLPPYSPDSTPSSGFGSTYANASYRSASSTHRGHHRRLLPSMDRPHRRTGSYANPLRLSMDHEGDFIGSLV